MRTIKFSDFKLNAPDKRRAEITIETRHLTIIKTGKFERSQSRRADETDIQNNDLSRSEEMNEQFIKTRGFLAGLLKAVLVIGLFVSVNAARANAAAFTVNNGGDTNDVAAGNGVCADVSGNCTLRAAIQEANALASDDAIYFSLPSPGTVLLTSGLGAITVSNAGKLWIYGSGAENLAISGNNVTRAFVINSGANVTIMRLTVRNARFTATAGTFGGNGSGSGNGGAGGAGGIANGGAILNNGTLSLFKVVLRNNQANGGNGGLGGSGDTGVVNAGDGGSGGLGGNGLGGAIHNVGTLYILNSTLNDNRAFGGNGGAGGAGGNGTFTDGDGGNGGAGGNGNGGNISNLGTIFITNSTVAANQTTAGLGGLGGTAQSGSDPGSVGITGTGNGGAFFNQSSGTITLRNATVSGNSAGGGNGGGIFNGGTVNFGNTIISDNAATFSNPDLSGTFNSLGANLIESTTGATINGTTAGNLTGIDPQLGTLQNNGGETTTKALGAASVARNAGNNALAIDPATNQPLTLDQRGFTSRFSGTIDIGAYESNAVPTAQYDFDGDGKADVSVFRPSNGVWYLLQSTSGFTNAAFGQNGDKIAPADYDGDGKSDVAVFRSGTWYIQRSQLGFTGVGFGAASDVPVAADFDGDGQAELAVFRPSNGGWYQYNLTTNQTNSLAFGQVGDIPVAADYDGDGRADIAVFRTGSGTWYLQRSALGFTGIAFGASTDKPAPSDYDGDGKSDVAVFRPSNGTWYLQQSTAGFTGVAFGAGTDIPAAADYDGDGKADVAVFRPSNGTWYLNRSTAGFTGIGFGANTDVPVPAAYIP